MTVKRYTVSVEIEGSLHKVGTIEGTDHHDACFLYDPDYLSLTEAVPISISLPLAEGSFDPDKTRNYFEGLLPEGFTRRSIAGMMHIDENDYLSMLHKLGRECLGAIRISLDGEEQPEEEYVLINEEQMLRLASEGVTESTEIIAKTHLSLTGASGKVGLYYDKDKDRWYFPMGTAPSTHIVKQSHIRLEDIVINEQLAMLTAVKCGLEVPVSFIVGTGSDREEDILFATQRFDRLINNESCLVSGLMRPLRLHQEDFSQALGIPAMRKYEVEGEAYLAAMFSLLKKYSSDPIRDQLKLWDAVVFNCLIGNTDAHIKNFSLLYSADLHSIRLAPLYDIVSTCIYESSTHELSMHIGDARFIDDLNRASFEKAADELGLGMSIAMRHLDEICNRYEPALNEAAEELNEQGFEKAHHIKDRILLVGHAW